MADYGSPQPADRYHAHFEQETAFGVENAGFPAAAKAIRLETGSTYVAQKVEIPDATLKEDDGSDESGVGDPEVSLSAVVKAEGLTTPAGNGVTAGETALTWMAECALGNDSDLYAGALAAAGATTSAITQVTGAADFATNSVAVFTTTAGLEARHVQDATALLLTTSMTLSSAPALNSVIYGTNVIPILRSHAGTVTQTLQVGLKDPLQAFNRRLYGLGCSGFELQDAAKGAHRNLKFDFMGADFSRGAALAVTQPSAARGRSGTNRQLWLAPIGSAQTATRFNVFQFSFKTNHNTQEVPTDGNGLANAGYNYILSPEIVFEVYENSVAIGSAGNWMEAWEDGSTDNQFQVMFQSGRTAGRMIGVDLVNVLINRPVVGNQNGRRTYICTGKCRTGTAANFGNLWFA